MIEYDADLVSDSSLTHTIVRQRLERCERKKERKMEGERERERRESDKGRQSDRFGYSGVHPVMVGF